MPIDVETKAEMFKPLIERMTKLRLEGGFTQSDLAQRASYSRKYVTLIELGERLPTLEALISLCSEVGMSRTEIENHMSVILDNFNWEE